MVILNRGIETDRQFLEAEVMAERILNALDVEGDWVDYQRLGDLLGEMPYRVVKVADRMVQLGLLRYRRTQNSGGPTIEVRLK